LYIGHCNASFDSIVSGQNWSFPRSSERGNYLMRLDEKGTSAATDRRAFLTTAGKFALVTPPTMTILLSTTLASPAIAASGRGSYTGGQNSQGDEDSQGGGQGSQGGGSQGSQGSEGGAGSQGGQGSQSANGSNGGQGGYAGGQGAGGGGTGGDGGGQGGSHGHRGGQQAARGDPDDDSDHSNHHKHGNWFGNRWDTWWGKWMS
jgi:hypothetical protein